MITDVAGVRVGHWTDATARTGCTVVLLPAGTMASAEVRGGAPASRELALLAPDRLVDRLDAVLLTGGSAFGLAAADGVVRWCQQRGIGFPTAAGPVPIVAGMGLFDLGVGDPSVHPGPAEGEAACVAATDGPVELGAVGAGAGATMGTSADPAARRPSGLVSATVREGGVTVSALFAVNPFGEVDHDGGGLERAFAAGPPNAPEPFGPTAGAGENTTIGVVATDARLSKVECLLVAQSAHDGLARSLAPAHTRVDGDSVVVAATGSVDADIDRVRLLGALAVERAIRTLPPPPA